MVIMTLYLVNIYYISFFFMMTSLQLVNTIKVLRMIQANYSSGGCPIPVFRRAVLNHKVYVRVELRIKIFTIYTYKGEILFTFYVVHCAKVI